MTNSASRSATTLWLALVIAGLAFATIAGAWIFQAYGYAPCELCLEQRPAYYFGAPIAAALALVAAAGGGRILAAGFALLALIFAANAIFGVYHSGVELMFWKGPTGCTGALAGPTKAADLLNQLNTIKVVPCDKVQLRVFGLSLANWNAFISATLAALAARAAFAKA